MCSNVTVRTVGWTVCSVCVCVCFNWTCLAEKVCPRYAVRVPSEWIRQYDQEYQRSAWDRREKRICTEFSRCLTGWCRLFRLIPSNFLRSSFQTRLKQDSPTPSICVEDPTQSAKSAEGNVWKAFLEHDRVQIRNFVCTLPEPLPRLNLLWRLKITTNLVTCAWEMHGFWFTLFETFLLERIVCCHPAIFRHLCNVCLQSLHAWHTIRHQNRYTFAIVQKTFSWPRWRDLNSAAELVVWPDIGRLSVWAEESRSRF